MGGRLTWRRPSWPCWPSNCMRCCATKAWPCWWWGRRCSTASFTPGSTPRRWRSACRWRWWCRTVRRSAGRCCASPRPARASTRAWSRAMRARPRPRCCAARSGATRCCRATSSATSCRRATWSCPCTPTAPTPLPASRCSTALPRRSAPSPPVSNCAACRPAARARRRRQPAARRWTCRPWHCSTPPRATAASWCRPWRCSSCSKRC